MTNLRFGGILVTSAYCVSGAILCKRLTVLVARGLGQCQRLDSSEIRLRILWPICRYRCQYREHFLVRAAARSIVCYRMSSRRDDAEGRDDSLPAVWMSACHVSWSLCRALYLVVRENVFAILVCWQTSGQSQISSSMGFPGLP
jgi:hypothetical protein